MVQNDIDKKLLNEDERIARYLQGEMNPDEENTFISELNSDNAFRENAIIQARLIKGMKQSDEELVNAIKQTKISDIQTLLKGKAKRNLYTKWISIAASVIFIFVGGYKGYDYYNVTHLGMEYAHVFPVSEAIQRGDSDMEAIQELKTLFNNVINRENLSTTIPRLANLWEISTQEVYNDYTNYAPYIGWYLTIAYLEDYKKDKAKEILINICSDDNYAEYIKIHAKQLLLKL